MALNPITHSCQNPILVAMFNKIGLTSFTSLIGGLLFSLHCQAQPTFELSDLVMFPSVSYIAVTTLDSAAEGTAGENQIWDFTFLSGVEDPRSISALNGPDIEYFPAGSFSICGFGSQAECTYHHIDENGFLYYGWSDADYFIPYSDPLVYVPLPFEYGQTFTDEYYYENEVGSLIIEGNVDMTVDGYGTLLLPSDTFALAYRVHGNINETVVVSGEIEQSYGREASLFFVPGYPGPIVLSSAGELLIQDIGQPIEITITTYLESFNIPLSTDQEQATNFLNLYPNPTNGILNISLENHHENFSVIISDLQGRVVYSGIPESRANNLKELDLSALKNGVYILKIGYGDSFQTKRVEILR